MFYKSRKACYSILDVFRVSRKSGNRVFYPGREFAGLSFRCNGESVLLHGGTQTPIMEKSITYLPPHVDFEIRSQTEEVIILHLRCMGEEDPIPVSLVPKDPTRCEALLTELYTRHMDRKPGYENRCMSLLYMLFYELEKGDAPSSPKAEGRIREGVLYLDRHFDSPTLSIWEAARECDMSEVYFRRLFKEVYGITPIIYLQGKRIDRARTLLESGYYRIYEVAGLSGFNDAKYFSTVFRQETGMTPKEYAASVRGTV